MFCKLAFLCMSLAIVPILFRSLGGQSILEATSLSSSSWALSSPSCPAQIAAVYQHRPWSNMKIQHWSNLQNVEVQYDTWLTCIYIYAYICVLDCSEFEMFTGLEECENDYLLGISKTWPTFQRGFRMHLNLKIWIWTQSHLSNACNTGNHVDLCSVRQFCVSSIFTLKWGRKWHNSKFVGYFYAIRIPGSTAVGIFSRLFCTVISLGDPSLMIPPLPPPPLLLHLPDKLADFLHHTTRNRGQNEKVNVLSLFHGLKAWNRNNIGELKAQDMSIHIE